MALGGLLGCTVGCSAKPETVVLKSLVSDAAVGQALPENVERLGRFAFVPEYGYSLAAADSALLFQKALFFSGVGQSEPLVRPKVRAVILSAVGERGIRLAQRSEVISREAYGKAPRLGCFIADSTRRQEVRYWRHGFGGVYIVQPPKTDGGLNLRDPTAVHVVAPWALWTGAIPRLDARPCN